MDFQATWRVIEADHKSCLTLLICGFGFMVANSEGIKGQTREKDRKATETHSTLFARSGQARSMRRYAPYSGQATKRTKETKNYGTLTCFARAGKRCGVTTQQNPQPAPRNQVAKYGIIGVTAKAATNHPSFLLPAGLLPV
jgi:hypothetical protein